MSESQCKCGKRIVWGLLDDGKRVPLDPVPPVYTYDEATGKSTRVKFAVVYVNHFATCRFANEFSKSKKEEPTA
jgi:hypothetical protein